MRAFDEPKGTGNELTAHAKCLYYAPRARSQNAFRNAGAGLEFREPARAYPVARQKRQCNRWCALAPQVDAQIPRFRPARYIYGFDSPSNVRPENLGSQALRINGEDDPVRRRLFSLLRQSPVVAPRFQFLADAAVREIGQHLRVATFLTSFLHCRRAIGFACVFQISILGGALLQLSAESHPPEVEFCPRHASWPTSRQGDAVSPSSSI